MTKTELLLPAGHYDALKAAIAAGADAVYLAGNAYGARAGAGNFDREEMTQALRLAHHHGVRAYAAVNTLIGDDELQDALEYVKFLYDLGIDGVILQDLGLAGAIKVLLPSLPLHGSTQMTVHNVYTARFAAEFGFERVILARETTLTEIAAIRKAVPDLELEVFCHGALCICYSGQCLMSSIIGGRSGNRGRCAQPCRLVYDLLDGFGKPLTEKPAHLLSPKDLQSLDVLPELLELGIDGLKVEGRMRRPEYVATVGRIYRQAIDSWYAKDFHIDSTDRNDLAQAFNRDFSDGYFHGNPGAALMSRERPNNRGVLLGRIKAVDDKRVTIDLIKELRLGDGIEIWVKVGGRCGVTVSTLRVKGQKVEVAYAGQEAEIVIDGNIRPGDRVFKTYDDMMMSAALEAAHNIEEDIPLQIEVEAHLGRPLLVRAADGRGHEVEITTSYVVESAKTTPTDEAAVKKQIARLGNSGYALESLRATLDDGIILPASILNRARRDAVTALDQQIFKRYPHVADHTFATGRDQLLATQREKKKHNVPALAVKVRNVPQIAAALDGGAEIIYFAPHLGLERLSENDYARLSEWNQKLPGTLVYALPTVCPPSFEDALQRELKQASDCGFRHFLAGQSGDILRKNELGAASFWGDFSLNVFNNETTKQLQEAGFDGITCSLELTRDDLARLAHQAVPKEVVVHGSIPMMISRHCLIGACAGKNKNHVPCALSSCPQGGHMLEDRLGMHFPVVTDVYHLMHIYNCKDLALIDELSSLYQFERWRIEGQLYDIGSLREIVSLYRQARDAKGGNFDDLRPYQPAGYTKGHFHRGVKD